MEPKLVIIVDDGDCTDIDDDNLVDPTNPATMIEIWIRQPQDAGYKGYYLNNSDAAHWDETGLHRAGQYFHLVERDVDMPLLTIGQLRVAREFGHLVLEC
jgi:hypothetical protein